MNGIGEHGTSKVQSIFDECADPSAPSIGKIHGYATKRHMSIIENIHRVFRKGI